MHRHNGYVWALLAIGMGIASPGLCADDPVSSVTERDANGSPRRTLFGSIASFHWQEYAASGASLLEESGPLFGASARWIFPQPAHAPGFFTEVTLGLQGGVVDYDGKTNTGVPLQSRTERFAFHGAVLEGWTVTPLPVELFAGLDFHAESRTLRDSKTAAGQPVSGYTERYLWTALRAGAGAIGEFGGVRLHGRGGIHYPAFVFESVGLASAGYASNVDLKPVGVVSPWGSVELSGWKGSWLLPSVAALRYESLVLDASKPVSVKDALGTTVSVHQPEIRSDVIWLDLGWDW